MTPDQIEIQRHLTRIDEVAVAYEAKWGIGNLQAFASDELRKKWDAQMNKLSEAIKSENLPLIEQLCAGTIKGWGVLESAALAAGYEPTAPECMEIELQSGFKLRIAKNGTEARRLTEKGVYVWTLEEVARVLEKDYTLVNVIKASFEGAEVKRITKRPFQDDSNLFPF